MAENIEEYKEMLEKDVIDSIEKTKDNKLAICARSPCIES